VSLLTAGAVNLPVLEMVPALADQQLRYQMFR